MRLLYFGFTKAHCNDNSLYKALLQTPKLDVELFDPARFSVEGDGLLARAIRRVTEPLGRVFMRHRLIRASKGKDVLFVFKGNGIHTSVLRKLRSSGTRTVVYFPDGHPHAYGSSMRDGLGFYDLVISAKAHHPTMWQQEFGYKNCCVCVPHGYDCDVHLYGSLPAPEDQVYDLAIVATARKEYRDLLVEMVRHAPELVDSSVLVAGNGWAGFRDSLPRGWSWSGPLYGVNYSEGLRRAKIVIAPVQRRVRINGTWRPYDNDSARTYEIPAMGCFCLHRYSELMPSVYDPETEVPLFRSGRELAALVRRYLADPSARQRFARAAHSRAVPAYSWEARAADCLAHIRVLLRGASSQ